MYAGVDPVSCADDFLERVLVSDHYERSGLVLGHPAACFGQVVHLFARAHVVLLPAQQPVDDGPALRIVHIPVAQIDQELPDLRLEYDDDGKYSDVQDHVHDRRHEPHVERPHDNADDVERHDSHEDAHRGRTAKPSERQEYYDA